MLYELSRRLLDEAVFSVGAGHELTDEAQVTFLNQLEVGSFHGPVVAGPLTAEFDQYPLF